MRRTVPGARRSQAPGASALRRGKNDADAFGCCGAVLCAGRRAFLPPFFFDFFFLSDELLLEEDDDDDGDGARFFFFFAAEPPFSFFSEPFTCGYE